jgi:hypothetical protein
MNALRKLSARGKLNLSLAVINVAIALVYAFTGSLLFIFNFIIGFICWLGLYDKRSWK